MPADILLRSDPFPHALVTGVLTEESEWTCLGILEGCAWHSHSLGFATFDIPDTTAPYDAVLKSVIGARHRWCVVAEQLGACAEMSATLELHRYGVGSGIGAHTDASANEVRIVLNLNRRWAASEGGVWVLGADAGLRIDRRLLPPISNTGFTFATAACSFHALTKRFSGESFGITIKLRSRA